MAVGDVVAGVATSSLSFQPAAGVECVIKAGCIKQYSQLTDGTNSANVWFMSDTSAVGQNPGTGVQDKLFINNSIYLKFTGTTYTDGAFYSGIQIK